MAFKVEVSVKLARVDKILKETGLSSGGLVQVFHTQNVLSRIQKYMPYQSGALIKLMLAHTNVYDDEIVLRAPQATFLYKGKLMVSDVTGSAWARKGETKHATNTDLTYNKEKNQNAGPEWDARLVDAEGEAMTTDLQKYINQLAKGNK